MQSLKLLSVALACAILGNASAEGTDTIADSCPLTCMNGSVCKKGESDFSEHDLSDGSELPFLKETGRDGWFCDCEDGWTGLRCGRKFETCTAPNPANPHFCYHGGACLSAIIDPSIMDEDKIPCDCSEARHNGVPYVGKYCEHEAVFCDPGNERMNHKFCVNGGSCKADFKQQIEPCECLSGYTGPNCQYKADEVPDCDLTCNHDGACQFGKKVHAISAYDNYWTPHIEGMHCLCADGWFGPRCEIASAPCGDEYCFNSASCEPALDDGGSPTWRCKCGTLRPSGDTVVSFGGQHCQATSTSFCKHEADSNGRLFCANGGTCDPESGNGHLGCKCPEGFTGTLCEIRTNGQEPVEEPTCSLKCDNGGKCRKGFKDISLNSKFGPELDNFEFNATHNADWEHCVCPGDYFGIKCQHKIDVCDGGEHVCLHGSKCIEINQIDDASLTQGGIGKTHQCDCAEGLDPIDKKAGKFCQYSSTQICTGNGQPGAGKAEFAFCVNNGACKKFVEDNEEHAGCKCEPGYEGQHCEFLEGRAPKPPHTNGSQDKKDDDEDTDSKTSDTNETNSNNKSNGKSKAGLAAGLAIGGVALAIGLIMAAVSLVKRQRMTLAKSIEDTDSIGPESDKAPSTVDSLDTPHHGTYVGSEFDSSVSAGNSRSGDDGHSFAASAATGSSASDTVEIL